MQRPGRYVDGSGAMTRGKRDLEPADVEGEQQDLKRQKIPALASVIVEALKVDSLQKLCSSLEPVLRRVVSEEVERALANLGPPRLSGSSSNHLAHMVLMEIKETGRNRDKEKRERDVRMTGAVTAANSSVNSGCQGLRGDSSI